MEKQDNLEKKLQSESNVGSTTKELTIIDKIQESSYVGIPLLLGNKIFQKGKKFIYETFNVEHYTKKGGIMGPYEVHRGKESNS